MTAATTSPSSDVSRKVLQLQVIKRAGRAPVFYDVLPVSDKEQKQAVAN